MKEPVARTVITDLTNAGEVFNALSSTTVGHEFSPNIRPQQIDAIVHFAAIPRIMTYPDNEVFRINVMGTYNVLDAASKLGIKKVILASSETTYGIVFADEYRNPLYFPLDEEYPTNQQHPMDSYATSKVINETTARMFHERSDMDIYCYRIGNVIDVNDYEKFPEYFENPEFRRRITWSYIDVRDLAQACRLGIEKDNLGFQIFNVAADDVSSDIPTQELLKRFYPNVPLKKEFTEFETLLSNEKIKRILNFKQEHTWRMYVKNHVNS
jgi:nucleoside-diphosphate-sugar epimerase